jgi:hypothetical protein
MDDGVPVDGEAIRPPLIHMDEDNIRMILHGGFYELY